MNSLENKFVGVIEASSWSISRALGLYTPFAWLNNRFKKKSTSEYAFNSEYIVAENYYNEWALYRSSQPRFALLKTIVDELKYESGMRRFQAVSGLCAIDNLKVPKSPKVLMVGYREETYEVQALLKLGFSPKIDYMDLTPVPRNKILEIDKFDSFSILKQDARDLYKNIKPNAYDLIYFGRDCLDVFFWEDALKVIEGALHGAKVGVIAHIQSIFWTLTQNQGKSLTADWLVLDLLADAIMGEPFGAKVSKHLRNYAIRTGSKQIYKIVSDSKTNKELIQAISCMGSDNRDRILTLTDFPGKPLLCSVQLDSSPFSRNQKYYMSSVLLWRKPSG